MNACADSQGLQSNNLNPSTVGAVLVFVLLVASAYVTPQPAPRSPPNLFPFRLRVPWGGSEILRKQHSAQSRTASRRHDNTYGYITII